MSDQILRAICTKKGLDFAALGTFDLQEYKGRQYDLLSDVVRCGLDMELIYRIINRESGALLVTGSTEHCFLGRDGRVLALRRADPALAERFAQLCRADADAFAAANAAD